MRKVISIMCVLTVLVGSIFAGGAGESGGKKEVVLWCAYSQPERIEAMDATIAQFEAENPDIHVVRELVPWSNINQKWITSKMANSLPNLVVASDSDLIRMWESGDLEPVNNVIDMIGGPEAFLEGPLNGFKVGDDYIAVPHYTLSWKMVIRTDWLEELGLEIPETWDELYDVAVAMADPPNRYGFDLPMAKSAMKSKEWLCYFMRTNDAYFFDEEGNVTFNSPETIETVQFLVDMYKASGRSAAVNYTENDCIDNFANGNVGIIFASGSLVQNVGKIDPTVLDNCAVIDTPYNKHPNVDGAGPVGIGKFKGVANSEEADKFLAFLLGNQDIYREFLLSMSGQIPVTVAGTEDQEYWSDPLIADHMDLTQRWIDGAMTGVRIGMEYGLTPVASAGIPGSEIEDMFQSIIVDGVPVETAVKNTHDIMVSNLQAAGYAK